MVVLFKLVHDVEEEERLASERLEYISSGSINDVEQRLQKTYIKRVGTTWK